MLMMFIKKIKIKNRTYTNDENELNIKISCGSKIMSIGMKIFFFLSTFTK